MNKEIFKSERYFTIWDYQVSHGQLLLRSDKRKGHEKNIDIIFFDSTYIQLFAMLYGVSIRKLNKNENIKYNSVKEYLNYDNSYLFEIESGKEQYYIAASFVRVFENELGFNETSLGVLQFQGREKEIGGSL